MGKKYVDEFVRMPLDKMAASISDMTYTYENTVVPKEVYKKLLNKELMEVLGSDTNIEMNLLKPYYDMISDMKKSNPMFFFKALLLVETGTTFSSLSSTQIHALMACWEKHTLNKEKTAVKNEIINLFKEISQKGIDVYYSNDDDDFY